VIGVYSADDLPLVPSDSPNRAREPLARDRVLFDGQPVAAVVATSEAAAEDAAGPAVPGSTELHNVTSAAARRHDVGKSLDIVEQKFYYAPRE
jgi:xanthine dehydrogenase molybdopterin-binding subunit B